MKNLLKIFLFFLPIIIFSQSSETFDVYTTIINNNFSKNKRIAIEELTSGMQRFENLKYKSLKSRFGSLENQTFEDFLSNNKMQNKIQNKFSKEKTIIIIKNAEVKEIFSKQNGWDFFYNKYGQTQGILTFSCVGFNKLKNQALLYYGNQSHWLSGSGFFVLLSKKNNKWTIVNTDMLWIS